MNKRLALRALIIFAVGGIVMAAVLAGMYVTRPDNTALQEPESETTLAAPGSVPIGGDFKLVDHTGQTVTEADFRGRYLLIYFGFSYCPDVCPTTLNDIALALDQLGPEAEAVQPLFISLDPARDTPDVLADYVQAFHPRLVGLTGTKAQIDKVATAYKVFYEKVSPAEYYNQTPDTGDGAPAAETAKTAKDDYMIRHQGNTYLMSPDGDYIAHFSYGTKPSVMANAMRRAIARFGTPVTEAR